MNCYQRARMALRASIPSQSQRIGILVLLFALCALPAAVYAQSGTATLSGTVSDPNGAVVPGVVVTVTDPATRLQRKTTTNDAGQFTFPLLPPSKYMLTLERQGFMTAAVDDVVLNVDDERSLRIQMKVGDVKEVVNVTGQESLINESAAVGTVVDRQFVENMPLNGRSFQSLIALTPGVVLTKATGNEAGQFSVNGQRANANYFTVDGVGANIGVGLNFLPGQLSGGTVPGLSATGGTNNLVSIDALQEFKIQTSTYAPEFGRTPGAQVSIVTRAGTNSLRGTIFEYLRNDKLDANDWFANKNGQPRSALRQNIFGAVLGGPVRLPKYNGRDRTFFFFSYEGQRLLLPQFQITDVPSLTSRQTAMDAMKPYLNAFPLPTSTVVKANGFSEFASGYSNPASVDATSIRIDHAITDRVSLFGRYSDSQSKTVLL